MAYWLRRIGIRLNLFNVLILKVLLAQAIRLGYFSNNLFTEAVDLCENVYHCTCLQEEYNFFEIQCPNKVLQTYPMTAKVYIRGNDATLELLCDYETSEFDWKLISGLNFSSAEVDKTIGFAVTKLIVRYCPVPSEEVGIANMLKHFEIDENRVKHFEFISYRDIGGLPDCMLSPLVKLSFIDLSGNKLTSLPNLTFFPDLKHLELHSNQIMNLSEDSFIANKFLQRLQLRNNNLTEIPERSLPESLEILDLQSNKISKLTNATFSNLKSLRVLYLNGNPLEDMDTHDFTPLSQLEVLKVGTSRSKMSPNLENGISSEDISMPAVLSEDEGRSYKGIISNLPSLANLTLSNSGLTAVPSLQNLPNLTNLVLNGNKIRRIKASAFLSLPLLKKLDLSYNEMRHVPDILAKNLIELDLSSNKIDRLGRSICRYLDSLEKLSLARNQIEYIDRRAFDALADLKELDLSHNLINLANPGAMGQGAFLAGYSPLRFLLALEKINLAHNQINSLPNDFYTTLLKLSTINLEYNEFTSLRAVDLNFIQGSVEVDLRNNRISVVNMNHYNVFLYPEVLRDVVVRLDDNPLHCDCALLQFKRFNMKSISFRMDGLRCSGPSLPKDLTGKPFQSVQPDDLLCPLAASDGCPEGCNCWRRPSDYTIVINCAGKYKLSNNKLPKLNITMKFPNAEKYGALLDLSDNSIQKIPDEYAAGLPSILRAVDLRRNLLQSLSFLKAIGDNNSTRFNLLENPFPCYDCSFQTDSRSCFSRILDAGNLTCRIGVYPSGYLTEKAFDLKYENICSARLNDIIVPVVVAVMLIYVIVRSIPITRDAAHRYNIWR